jgi:hypothetical protein
MLVIADRVCRRFYDVVYLINRSRPRRLKVGSAVSPIMGFERTSSLT